jgi:hypothetical protein
LSREYDDLNNFRKGDLVGVYKHYRDEHVHTGIFVDTCPYEMFVKVLTSDGRLREFDTVYYYLVRL